MPIPYLRPAALLHVLGGLAAMPAWAFVTVGSLENQTTLPFTLRPDGPGLQFLDDRGELRADARGWVTLPAKTTVTVNATLDYLDAGKGFVLAGKAEGAGTLELRMETGRVAARRWTFLKAGTATHRPDRPGDRTPFPVRHRMEGSILVLWTEPATAKGAGAGAGPAASRAPGESKAPAPIAKPAAAAVESKTTTATAGAGAAGESKAASADGLARLQERQLVQIRAAIEGWRRDQPQEPVRLILGMRASEAGRLPAGHWICMDAQDHGDGQAPHFQGCFNDPAQVRQLALALRGQVDVVCFDWGVVYFTQWTGVHLRLIRAMLTPGGELELPLTFRSSWPDLECLADPGSLDADAYAAACRLEDQPLPMNVLTPRNFFQVDQAVRDPMPGKLREQAQVPKFMETLKGVFDRVERASYLPAQVRVHPALRGSTKPLDLLVCKRPS